MSAPIYIFTILLLPLTAIVVFAMKYASSYAAARARLFDEQEIKGILSVQASQLAHIAATLDKVEADVAQQTSAVSDVQTILKQVG